MHNWDNSIGSREREEQLNTDTFWTVTILAVILLVFMVFFMRSISFNENTFTFVKQAVGVH